MLLRTFSRTSPASTLVKMSVKCQSESECGYCRKNSTGAKSLTVVKVSDSDNRLLRSSCVNGKLKTASNPRFVSENRLTTVYSNVFLQSNNQHYLFYPLQRFFPRCFVTFTILRKLCRLLVLAIPFSSQELFITPNYFQQNIRTPLFRKG